MSTLRPLAVRQYAEARQWLRGEYGGPWRIWVLRHPEQKLRQLQIPMDEEPEPFTRRVTKHLMRVTSELVRSIEHTSVDEYLDAQSERPALSSNLCEALLRMQPRGDEELGSDAGHLEVSTTWAADPRVPPPSEAETPSRVIIKAAYMREIERAAQRLRRVRSRRARNGS